MNYLAKKLNSKSTSREIPIEAVSLHDAKDNFSIHAASERKIAQMAKEMPCYNSKLDAMWSPSCIDGFRVRGKSYAIDKHKIAVPYTSK